ncbi:sigma-54-dependent transcriptional regulator [Mesoterricola silvestris]|uniref:Acetoacetate metabolism regulatory protein AtoC n=1 Tax=Mesoterricola silvestris TaxID=2927979 RepID=A0AA48K844_9BACT|nr:sigma-54 dependent transcriptional regulator [Mesoterricola silvestris]BDU70957.1 acetoacetate metabolism regulatory protein AtoC [Mesoterricola silvestris]
MARVLVVDDSQETCDLLELLLGEGLGLEVAVVKATRPEDALRHLRGGGFDLMLSDINLEASLDGLDLLKAAKPLGVETILLTGFGTLEKALEAVREGAFDFISKPWNNDDLKSLVKRALVMKGSGGGPKDPALGDDLHQSVMIGSSPKMMEVYRTIASLQNSRTTVLIIGESGTGKELVAQNIHLSSDRKACPFVAINCGALTEGLLESELFGHVKGAFTGAVADKKGLFEEASGGTIFLDEIGETSLGFQVRLLRVLQEHEVRKVGGNKTVKVDVRVIAASNRDLAAMVKAGKFREDLYYRLCVVEIRVPPVRERFSRDARTGQVVSDIPALMDHFLAECSRKDSQIYRLRADARKQLEGYSWPGNVREMGNIIEHLTQLSRGREITPDDFPEKIRDELRTKGTTLPLAPTPLLELIQDWDHLPTLEELERRYIQVLLKHEHRKSRIADILGKDRTTLYRKLKDLGLAEGPEEGL